MNLGQIRAAIDRRTGIAVDPVGLVDWINEANRAIGAEQDWPWQQALITFDTVKGTDSYASASGAVPADWLRTIAVKLADDGPMTWRSRTQLDDEWPSLTSGRPREWTVENATIVLRPVPDAVVKVTHRYVSVDPELVADGDVPRMPALFHAAIVEHAAAGVLRRARESVRAAECEASYARWLARMLDDARRHSGPAKVRVRVRR